MSSVLITGGTGSFGNALTQRLLAEGVERVVIYSRDEVKQAQMAERFKDTRLRFFLGDVRDRGRLLQAMRGCTRVFHAAALKRIDLCEYNPTEAIQTNILGTENVLEAALGTVGMATVVVLSTDKACNPVNLYGATKLCVEKLTVAANAYVGNRPLRFMALRYGNVAGSRGSVIPVWRERLEAQLPITLTHPEMTRYWITLPEAVQLALTAEQDGKGGEVFIPKLPAYELRDLAEAMTGQTMWQATGLRPGEKMHEAMIGPDEAHLAADYGAYLCLHPAKPWKPQREDGKPTGPDSSQYAERLSVEELRRRLADV